ncbi:hypothetical protein OKW38_004738 [Paraburkholderia sp. MM5496-R1]
MRKTIALLAPLALAVLHAGAFRPNCPTAASSPLTA